MSLSPFNVALIIPTGIGAVIGGYGGDAMTLLPLVSTICDTVITHPNVANAACFQRLPDNVLYVEGYALDRFFAGDWQLQPVRQNAVGVILDAGIPKDMAILHQNTVAAVQTVYGVDIVDIVTTDESIQLNCLKEPSGRSAGQIENPHKLLEAGQDLVRKGAKAIAVCCLMPACDDEIAEFDYQNGQGVDPIGGLEAMISHWLISQLKVPVAHAPVFSLDTAMPVTDKLLDPRAASEFIVSTFLPCVLTGLSKAPQYNTRHPLESAPLSVDGLSALVVPADALGSLPVLAALEKRIPVLTVQNNTTVMDATASALNITQGVISCQNYLEVLGHLVALKSGITLPPHIKANTRITTLPLVYAKA